MVRDDLVALAADPPQIAPAQLALSERLDDQQSRRVGERLHHARQRFRPLAIERGSDFLSSFEVKTQQVTRIHRHREHSLTRVGVF